MTFTPDSKVRLCSVPFSDYTNVLSFKIMMKLEQITLLVKLFTT